MGDNTPIRVAFRIDDRYPGEPIAVFPDCEWDRLGNITTYAHVGQHGSGSWGWIRAHTRPATPTEYAPLLRELRSIGYVVRVLAVLRRRR